MHVQCCVYIWLMVNKNIMRRWGVNQVNQIWLIHMFKSTVASIFFRKVTCIITRVQRFLSYHLTYVPWFLSLLYLLQADGACYSPFCGSTQYIATCIPREQNTQNAGIFPPFLLFSCVLNPYILKCSERG